MNGMELDDGVLLLMAKLSTLNVRSKVIGPSQSAAFATSFESYVMNEKHYIFFFYPTNVILLIKWYNAKKS